MPLFVAQHQHQPEACSTHSGWESRLLSHVSASGAACYGVAIQAEAMISEAHTLLLIVEAASPAHVERFMAVFTAWGSVEVHRASSTEETIRRGGCGTAIPP